MAATSARAALSDLVRDARVQADASARQHGGERRIAVPTGDRVVLAERMVTRIAFLDHAGYRAGLNLESRVHGRPADSRDAHTGLGKVMTYPELARGPIGDRRGRGRQMAGVRQSLGTDNVTRFVGGVGVQLLALSFVGHSIPASGSGDRLHAPDGRGPTRADCPATSTRTRHDGR